MSHNNSTSRQSSRRFAVSHFGWRISIAATLVVLALAIALPAFRSTSASTPSGATINSTATTAINWTGTGTGGGALNAPLGLVGGEDLCQEGLTCDTFTLTVGGTAADWSGKLIRIKLEWLLPVTDYDLYIHKDSNSGPVVASSGRGATSPTEPLTWEDTTIDPSVSGTGIYTVRAFTISLPLPISITAVQRSRLNRRNHRHQPVDRNRSALSELSCAAGAW
jgi:hypothetical protein